MACPLAGSLAATPQAKRTGLQEGSLRVPYGANPCGDGAVRGPEQCLRARAEVRVGSPRGSTTATPAAKTTEQLLHGSRTPSSVIFHGDGAASAPEQSPAAQAEVRVDSPPTFQQETVSEPRIALVGRGAPYGLQPGPFDWQLKYGRGAEDRAMGCECVATAQWLGTERDGPFAATDCATG